MKQALKYGPSVSFKNADGTEAVFTLWSDGLVWWSLGSKLTGFSAKGGNALDVIANLRQAAAEIERMYFEQEGK